MVRSVRAALREVMPWAVRERLRRVEERLLMRCLEQAVEEQGLRGLYQQLVQIVPDIRHQYSTFTIDTEYLTLKVRALHAFQVFLFQRSVELLEIGTGEEFTVVDVGDSSGTHAQYLRALYPNARSVSVNVDKEAVNKIRGKGLEAVHAGGEEIASLDLVRGIFLSFEMLEHLVSPISFLRLLSNTASCRALVVTVPYLTQSRVGLHYIRSGERAGASPERIHIFELSREDWRVVFRFSGWRVVHDQTYLQYPRRRLLRAMKMYWKQMDFEGFYGAILQPDDSWSKLYGWSEVLCPENANGLVCGGIVPGSLR